MKPPISIPSEQPQGVPGDAEQKANPKNRSAEQSLVPSAIKGQQAEKTKGKPNADGKNGIEQWLDAWLKGWGLSDMIAGIAAVAGLFQFFALIATIAVMIKNGRKQMRAYLGVDEAHIIMEAVPGKPLPMPRAQFKIKNFGQTPAYDVCICGEIESATDFKFVKNKSPDIFTKNAVIAPGQYFEFRLFMKNWTIPEGTDAIHTFVFGKIIYTDAFKRRRYLSFRCTAVKLPNDNKGGLRPCEEGNDAN